MLEIGNFIGGSFVPVASTLDDVGPATGQVIARFPRSGAAEVNAAVAAAKAAFPAWAATPLEERARLLERVADRIEARFEEFAALESRDQGKPVGLARRMDIPRAIQNFRFFAGAARHQELPSHPMEGALNITRRKPLGVVGLITPWNLPLYLLTWKLAPALAMGNTCVAKPSELTPLTAHLLAEVFEEVGAPKGIFNLVHGLGAECGGPLCEHPDVKAISFTGGTVTGEKVAMMVAPRFKKLSLELGGKNATLVFADADLDEAVRIAAAASFTNQGEICLCGSRILVERSVYDRFVAAFVERVKALRVGDPSGEVDIGAINSAAHLEKVLGYVALAREEGGRVLCGGNALPGPGFFMEPTVIGGLSTTCRTATEEIFGPVVTVHPFDSEAEALEQANGTRYGLSATVFTSRLDRAFRVADALDVGIVWVNTWLLRDLRTPFGGVKDSGVGREGGRWSLEFFSETKNVCARIA